MNRRASLPGVDELFGASPGQSRRSEAPDLPADAVDEVALAGARRLLAAEPDVTSAARERAVGLAPPPPEVGALLAWAVTAGPVRTAVELGSAGGVTGLWLLPALPAGGVLTSIEPDPHAHGLATEALRGVEAEARVRSIQGEIATVLPRLSDAGYDLVLLQSAAADYPDDLTHIRRLLRPGGLLIARGVLRAGADGAALDRFLTELADDPLFRATVLPVDGGLVLATRLEPDA